MGLHNKWRVNRLIDRELGRDAHTEKGSSFYGDLVDGLNSVPVQVAGRAALGLCAVLLPIGGLIIVADTPSRPAPEVYTPSPTSSLPIYDLVPSSDDTLANDSLGVNPTTTTTTELTQNRTFPG